MLFNFSTYSCKYVEYNNFICMSNVNRLISSAHMVGTESTLIPHNEPLGLLSCQKGKTCDLAVAKPHIPFLITSLYDVK